jgi:hypothetical protein
MTTTMAGPTYGPLFRSAPPSTHTFGDLAAKVGQAVRLTPDPEQRWLLDAIYAEKAPHVPAAFEVCVVGPRQNIKSSTLEIAALTDLFVVGIPLSVWTAHQFKTCRKSFEDMRRRIIKNPEYNSRCKFRDSHGQEAIILDTGETIEFHARSDSSGRGFTCDRLTLDEALFLRPGDMSALIPTMVTVPDSQVRYGSSAGFSFSGALRGLRDRGRRGDDDSLAYVEYGAPRMDCAERDCRHTYGAVQGCALDDRRLWWAANCAMWSGRITEEAMQNQRKALATDPVGFMREFLSWWEEPDDETTAFDLNAWSAQADPGTERGDAFVYSVATAPDRSWAAVAMAWRRADGRIQVTLAEYRPGTTWVAQRLTELQDHWGAGPVIVDTASRGLVDDAEEPSQADQAIAQGAMYDAVIARTVWHDNHSAMNTAVKAAQWRPLGDTQVLDRKGNTDISPLAAACLAHHGVEQGLSSEASVFFFDDLDDEDEEDPDAQ